MLRGMFFWGSMASCAMHANSSNPMYPKKLEVAPLKIPVHPNCGGMKGVRFSLGFMRTIPTIAMKLTSKTLVMVKKLVTLVDSLTPFMSNRTERAEMRAAKGLKLRIEEEDSSGGAIK